MPNFFNQMVLTVGDRHAILSSLMTMKRNVRLCLSAIKIKKGHQNTCFSPTLVCCTSGNEMKGNLGMSRHGKERKPML